MIVEALLVLILAALLLIIWKIFKGDKDSRTLALLEEKHRQMLVDVNDSLNKLSDRFNKTVTDELTATRESLQKLQLSQQESLSKIREDVIDKLHKTLSEQGKGQQESLQSSLKNTSLQLMKSLESLTKSVDERLQEITGKVHERLEEGFKKTNATFVSVMERLATIDEAQKKIKFQGKKGQVSSSISKSRTTVKIGGEKSKRGNLKVGMECTIEYDPGHEKREASLVDCK